MRIFSLIKSIFSREKTSNEKKADTEKEENKTSFSKSASPDFIDYDGMGNQGRFPSSKKK